MPRATASLFFTWKAGLPLWLACLSVGICGSYFFTTKNIVLIVPSPTYSPGPTYSTSSDPTPTYSTSSTYSTGPDQPPPAPPIGKQLEELVQKSYEIKNQVAEYDKRIIQNKATAIGMHREISTLLTEGKEIATTSFKSELEKEESAANLLLKNCEEAHTKTTATKAEITELQKKVQALRYSNRLNEAKREVQSMENMLSAVATNAANSNQNLKQLSIIRDEIRAAVDASRRDTTRPPSRDSAGQINLSTIGNSGLQDLTYDVLHLLVGASPNGRSLDSLFATTVTDLTNGVRTSGSSIIRGINQLSNDYPARSVKFKHAGVQNEVLEIITARAFTDSSGNRVTRYGKTRITLNSRNLILSISDELYPAGTLEYEIDLSPGYMRIPYHRKTIISNSGK